MPLHATTQSVALPAQLTLPAQLPLPLQRTSHWPAEQRTSFAQLLCSSQETEQELPPQLRLPEQELAPLHWILQLAAA
jgi:hypothetical protein